MRRTSNNGKCVLGGGLLDTARLGSGMNVFTRVALGPKYSLNCRIRDSGTRTCCVLSKRKRCSSGKRVQAIGPKSIACASSNGNRDLRGGDRGSLIFVTLVVGGWVVSVKSTDIHQ